MKLYRLRPLADDKHFGWVKEIVETNNFHCSRFSELNDPMEGAFTILSENAKADIDRIYEKKREYMICSFSSDRGFENPAIWGYYANGFKGVAIEIDVEDNNIETVHYKPTMTYFNDLRGTDEIKVKKFLLIN